MNGLTLAEVLSLDVLAPATVLAGNDWLDHRRVEWISVIETPVEDFVRRDELVLTTGLGCGQDSQTLLCFVEEIMQAGAAGIAIAIGPHVPSIPQEIVSAAEGWHLPLMALPWDVRFSDITRRVVTEISLHTVGPTRVSHPVRQLLERLAHVGDLNAIVEAVSRLWDVPCAFYHAQSAQWYGVQGLVQQCIAEFDRLKPWLHRSRAHQSIDEPIRYQALELLSISSQGRWYGTLLVHRPPSWGTELRIADRELVCHVMALAVLVENTTTHSDDRAQNDFVWRLAKGEFAEWDQLLAVAGPLHYDVTQYYVCVVGRMENLEGLYRYSQTLWNRQPRDQWEETLVDVVQSTLRASAQRANYGVLVTYQRGEWLAYFLSAKRIEPTMIHHCLDEVHKALALHLPEVIISWGIAGAVPGVRGFHQSFAHARLALERGVRREGGGRRFVYEEVQENQVLERFQWDATIQELVETTMGALATYDQQHGTDLLHTLRAYLHNRTNVSLTARTLHLHRQSLLYRLNKIESLTGRSLDNADDLFVLELCVRILASQMPGK